jgi:hypothetical protein
VCVVLADETDIHQYPIIFYHSVVRSPQLTLPLRIYNSIVRSATLTSFQEYAIIPNTLVATEVLQCSWGVMCPAIARAST